MKEITLTKGKTAIVDDEDFDLLSTWSWTARPSLNTSYGYRKVYVNKKYQTVHMHRFILGTEKMVDHIDHNGLNNQKTNLRICTHSQNMCNARKRKNSSSRYKGVYWNAEKKKWHVRASFDGKKYNVGYYHNEIEAALAYNCTASFAQREFAYLNKIEI